MAPGVDAPRGHFIGGKKCELSIVALHQRATLVASDVRAVQRETARARRAAARTRRRRKVRLVHGVATGRVSDATMV